MSGWLLDGEVLVGEGRAEVSPCSRRPHGRGSVRSSRVCVNYREADVDVQMLPQDTLGKATELFLLCDKEDKGFMTRRDMQRLQEELPLTPEQLEVVFDSLDREQNGFLTPVEFHKGLGELLCVAEGQRDIRAHAEQQDDPELLKFSQLLLELGVDGLLTEQWDIKSVWLNLHREHPELLQLLKELLSRTLVQLRDVLQEKDSMEQALRRRELEHDQVLRSMCEEMDNQIREEREKQLSQGFVKESDRCQQLLEELKTRDKELENASKKQQELEKVIHLLRSEQLGHQDQNQKLHSINLHLQEQLETSRVELESTLVQLQHLKGKSTSEHPGHDRDMLRVSTDMQKEKESLQRQLELLREMNRRLRDQKDIHRSQQRHSYQSPVCTLLPHYSWDSVWLQPVSSFWSHPPVN